MDTIQLNDTYMAVEYNMLGTDILQTSPDILKSDSISALDVTRKGTNFTLSVTNSGTTGFIELPVFAYKGYLARSGRDRLNISSGFNNRLRIVIPAGYSGQINSCFAEPWYWRAAEIISLFTLIFVVTGFVRTFRVQKGE